MYMLVIGIDPPRQRTLKSVTKVPQADPIPRDTTQFLDHSLHIEWPQTLTPSANGHSVATGVVTVTS